MITRRVRAEEEIEQRNRELAALLDVSQRLAARLDLDELLDAVARAIVDTLPAAEAASLWLYDEHRDAMVARAWAGHDDEAISGLTLSPGTSLVGLVYCSRQPQIVGEVASEPAFEPVGRPALDAVRSVLGVPLLIEGRAIGALFADNFSHPQAFDEDNLRLLESLAGQAAVAIENARLYEAAQEELAERRRVEKALLAVAIQQARLHDQVLRRAAQQEALNAIIAAAAAAPDLPALLEVALEHTLQALGLEMGGIWGAGRHVVRGLSSEIDLAAAQAAQAADLDIPHTIVVEDWQAETGGAPYATLAPVMDRFGIRASLTVPILAEGQRIGGLSLAAPEPRAWSLEEVALVEAVGRQLGSAAERARLFAATREHAELMDQLVPLSEQLNRPRTQPEVLEAIGQGTMTLSGADRAAVYLRNPDDTVTCPWSQGFSPGYVELVTARVQELPGGRLLEQPEPILVPDVKDLPADSPVHGLAEAEGYRAFGAWPLVYEGRTVAAVGCYYDAPHAWSEVEHEVMEAFCRQAAIAIENARLYENLEDAYVETVLALANAVDARDAYTADHSQRLARWAEATARELGCSEGETEAIRWAALLHDIGKIGVPDRILQKPGPLTDEERAVIEHHPEIGEQIVAPVKRLADVAPIIRAHQERWDGTGYPDGLQGEAIPLEARVLAVVDAYGAMIDERPYKEARSHAEAVAELRSCAGTQFDPQAVEAFLRMMNAE